jgi:3-hydroxyacyl-CoA dehydrogenase, NAD binding domain/3-hydroxyacyl-CoA dehydrogenase, C-terminal domain
MIASSSSGLTMSEIQSGCGAHPERCVIGHPFNPPHLMPLVEIVGGAKTSEETIRRVTEFYTGLGKRPVRLHKELPGHVANRLQAALSREVYYLVSEGVVSAADADTACSWGPGLRWGIMGSLLLNHLGGGGGGIEHFFQQFTGPMTAWWKVLGQPVLTPEVQKKLIDSVPPRSARAPSTSSRQSETKCCSGSLSCARKWRTRRPRPRRPSASADNPWSHHCRTQIAAQAACEVRLWPSGEIARSS